MGHSRGGGLFVLPTGIELPSLIRSVQRGEITISNVDTSNTATITAVSMANSQLRYLGQTGASAGTTPDEIACLLSFTNETTITASVNTTSPGNRIVSFEVIEYWPGIIKTIQRGTVTHTAAQTGTTTITSVNANKTFLDYLGFTTDYVGGTSIGFGLAGVVLTNATTVTGTGALGSINRVIGFQAVEFY